MAGRVGGAILASAWLLALGIGFFLHRGDDVGRLAGPFRSMLGALARDRVVSASGLVAAAGGVLIGWLVVIAWLGLGDLIVRTRGQGAVDAPRALALASRCLAGAVVWSIVWLGFGIAHLYSGWVAVGALVIGLGLAGLAWLRDRHARSMRSPLTVAGRLAVAFVVIVLALALMAALAPPTARDALFYHFALPKAYLAAGGAVVVPYNMATFYPQGVEMQVVWAMLLGRLAGHRVAETAAGVTVFAFAPLLALITYGWARERDVDRAWASIAALMVVAVPTVYDIAGSGYVDLALAAYAALAVRAVGRWWSTLEGAWTVPLALAVAGALSIKLTAGFLVLALAVVVLVRAAMPCQDGQQGRAPRWRVAMTGAGGLLLGALIASPWYIRTWMRTGSPVFPFYLDIWPGEAPGWDVARSRLYQSLLSTYGDPQGVRDYVLAPIRLAVSAQPDQPARYDGVLGIAFLFALPVLAWAVSRRRLHVELRIAVLASTAMFLFWLFSSQQLRFLLPALPGFAVAMTASGMAAEAAGQRRSLQWLVLGAAAAGLPVILAWFAALDPVRAVLGGEPPAAYLSRRLDYYPYYELINGSLPPTARVWLINMRRDTYHLDRPYFSDFVFEDYTLTRYVRDAESADELRDRARAAGITHLLVRHDVLFDYARSPIVDDRQPRQHNLAKLQLLLDFFQHGARLIRGDPKFWLIELPRGTPSSGAGAGWPGARDERR
jgi:hypothetical protein